MISIATAAVKSITTTPTAIGSGASGAQAASASALALDSSWPVGCWWCQASGSRRYCLVTSRRDLACMRYCRTPARMRLPATPTALSRAVPTMSRTPVHSAAAVMSPWPKAGSTTFSVAQPSAHAEATVIPP
ncbi:hypothetical protein GCM10020219_034640 [Nonomuraea dietziae]